jgi:hypothetical protein
MDEEIHGQSSFSVMRLESSSEVDLNEGGPSSNFQAKHEAETPNILSVIIPTTKKKISAEKCRKNQDRKHTTSNCLKGK